VTELDAVLEAGRHAVREAARLCMLVAGEGAERLEKQGREPVTVADYGSQAIILGVAATRFPDHGVLSEEGSAHLLEVGGEQGARDLTALVGEVTGGSWTAADLVARIDHTGGEGPFVWAVDPIDGTKGFIRGDQFAVAVGILSGSTPVAGILGCPRLEIGGHQGVLAWGGPEIGAFVEPIWGGDAAPVEVSTVSAASEVRVLGSVETAHGDPKVISDAVEAAGLGGGWVRIDSQAKYAAVAAGLAEAYIRPQNRPDWRERVWDHAAGSAIVTGAGGRVTDLDGLPLDFSTGSSLEKNRGVVATNGSVHELVLEALR
jgi:3'(2'), 5'-bisphosphate nucleotidase